jgi:hypothetical protein
MNSETHVHEIKISQVYPSIQSWAWIVTYGDQERYWPMPHWYRGKNTVHRNEGSVNRKLRRQLTSEELTAKRREVLLEIVQTHDKESIKAGEIAAQSASLISEALALAGKVWDDLS